MASAYDALQRVLRSYFSGRANRHVFLKYYDGICRQIMQSSSNKNKHKYHPLISQTIEATMQKKNTILLGDRRVSVDCGGRCSVDAIVLKRCLDAIHVVQSCPQYYTSVLMLLSASRVVGQRIGTKFQSIHDEVIIRFYASSP